MPPAQPAAVASSLPGQHLARPRRAVSAFLASRALPSAGAARSGWPRHRPRVTSTLTMRFDPMSDGKSPRCHNLVPHDRDSRRGPRIGGAARSACRAGCARRRSPRAAAQRRTRRRAAGSSAARSRPGRRGRRRGAAALGRAGDLLAHVGVRRGVAEELQRSRATVAGDARIDHVRQGLSDLIDRIGDFGRIRGEPGTVGVRVLRAHPPSLAQRTRARAAVRERSGWV